MQIIKIHDTCSRTLCASRTTACEKYPEGVKEKKVMQRSPNKVQEERMNVNNVTPLHCETVFFDHQSLLNTS